MSDEEGGTKDLAEAAFQFLAYASDQDAHLDTADASMAAYVGRRLDQSWRWLDYALTRFIEPRYQGEASDDDRRDIEAALARVAALPSLTSSPDADPVLVAREHLKAAAVSIAELIEGSKQSFDVRQAAVLAYVGRRSFAAYRLAKYRWLEGTDIENAVAYRWLEA